LCGNDNQWHSLWRVVFFRPKVLVEGISLPGNIRIV